MGNTLLSSKCAYSLADSSWPSLREDDTPTLVVLTRMRTCAWCLCHCCSAPEVTIVDCTKTTAQVGEMKAKPTLVYFTGPANPDVEFGLNYWVQPHTQTLGIYGCIRTSIQRGMVGDVARSHWIRRLPQMYSGNTRGRKRWHRKQRVETWYGSGYH